MRAEHRHRLPGGGGVGGDRRQLQGRHVLEQTRQRRPGGAGHIGLGEIEQCGDRRQIAFCHCGIGPAAIGGTDPAPLQTAALPGLPQRVARIAVAAVAAGRCGEHRPDPGDRCGQGGRQLRSPAGERVEDRAFGATQGAAKLTQRHRIDPADGTGQQCLGGVVVESAFGGGQHGDKRTDAGIVDDGTTGGRRIDGNPGHRQRPGERGGRRHRSHDHRQLRPRHTIDEVGPAQRVGDHGGLGVCRRGHRHRDRSPLVAIAAVQHTPPGTGQSGRDPADRARDGRCTPV